MKRKKTNEMRFPRLSARPLVLVVLLLFLSSLTRVGMITSVASAADTSEPAHDSEVVSGHHPDPVFAELLSALTLREQELAAREAAIAEQLAAISLADRTIRENTAALIEAEQRLDEKLLVANQAASEDLRGLVAVYENMKPSDAASLFEAMSPEFAAGFLSQMRPDAAAPVLAGLNPETAYAISAIIAGRSVNIALE